MEIPNFSGDEDKYEINPMEWLRMIKEYGMMISMSPSGVSFYFLGGASKWWKILDEDTRLYSTWEKFEEIFSNKWIKDTKMEEMYTIQDELKEEKK
jgi:hypothetical protein